MSRRRTWCRGSVSIVSHRCPIASGMTSRIAAISMVAISPRLVAEFWGAVPGWPILQSDDTGADIGPGDGSGFRLEIGRVADEKVVKNRIHFDLRAFGTTQDENDSRRKRLRTKRCGGSSTWGEENRCRPAGRR
ncbi:MAG: VOC family protein [Humibacter sp.]